MKLKNGQLFWGFFFFTVGILFLLEKKDYLIIDFEAVWSYWPILLIIAGLSIMLKGTFVKPVLSIISGVLLGFFLFAPFVLIYHDIDLSEVDFNDAEYEHISFSEELLDTNGNATLWLEAGMGKVIIEGTTDKLFDGYFSGFINNYDVKTNRTDDRTIVKLDYEPHKIKFFGKQKKNILNIELNENPVWDMKLEFGAASANIDLSEYKIENFSMHTGASSTKLKFGSKTDTINANIEIGAASLKIYIPYDSGCKLQSNMLLISKDFEGFNKLDDGKYLTENFDNSANKIFIHLDGGVSSLKILRY